MKNNKFSGIRNNYFKGKQLTVRDFQDEQTYFCRKMKSIHYAVSGSGVAAGLDVVAVDNNSISIENGIAYDSYGREIVIDLPIIKKINLINGYNDIDDSLNTYLCLEYKEEMTEETFPVADSEKKEYNRISEGYNIFLTNKKPRNLSNELLSVIETTKEVFSSNNVTVKITVPRFVNVDEKLILTASVEKLNLNQSLNVQYEIEHENFSGESGQSTTVSYYNATDCFDVQSFSIALDISKKNIGITNIVIPRDKIKISVGDTVLTADDDVTIETEIIESDVEKRIKQEYFHINIDAFAEGTDGEYIYLAEIFMTKAQRTAYIEKVSVLPFNQYIMSNRLFYILQNIRKQPVQSFEKKQEVFIENKQPEKGKNEQLNVSSGVESIDIDVDYKGKIYYSSEIIHGLGEGNISYTIGFEPVDSSSNGTDNIVLFGSPLLFDGSPYNMEFPNIQYSIISYNDKGTFRIAVRLLDKVNAGNIKVHWQAVKTHEHTEKALMEIEKMTISIKPNLVNIEPRKTVSLECVIEGCDNLNCIWSVEDKNGGTIDRNGIYKAPSTEGVYTVTATSVKYPTKKAVNYIIVNKRKEL